MSTVFVSSVSIVPLCSVSTLCLMCLSYLYLVCLLYLYTHIYFPIIMRVSIYSIYLFMVAGNSGIPLISIKRVKDTRLRAKCWYSCFYRNKISGKSILLSTPPPTPHPTPPPPPPNTHHPRSRTSVSISQLSLEICHDSKY